MTMKKVLNPRTIDDILKQRPALKMIADVAHITDSNDQIWSYWISRIGAGKIIDLCRGLSGNLGKAQFADVHRCLMAEVAA